MINLGTVKFGTDAELFLKTLEGKPFPVCGLIGGTKQQPLPVESGSGVKGFALQEDNSAVEFNVPATSNITKLLKSCDFMTGVIKSRLPEALLIDFASSVVYDDVYLRIPQMNVFGCEPDFNAFTQMSNARPHPEVAGFRTAAAHVHIGWANPEDEDRIELIRLADVFVTLHALHSEQDDEIKRRTLYGKAGAFRFKEYGVEHRVLSNRWISNHKLALRNFCGYVDAIIALNFGIKVDPKDYKTIMCAINDRQLDSAKVVRDKYVEQLQVCLKKSNYTYMETIKSFGLY